MQFTFANRRGGPHLHNDQCQERLDLKHLSERNDALHCKLDIHKEGITRHAQTKKWDRFKKYCNDYELVCTSIGPGMPRISAVAPISRAFFKLLETRVDLDNDVSILKQQSPIRAVFLAEGPGGFVEAFSAMRAGIQGDQLLGMTLLSANKSIPNWRLTGESLCGKSFVTYAGGDGTGNIYHIENIDGLVTQAGGPGQTDFITADGGFDFSGHYRLQEQIAARLICAEIYAALRLQKVGSSSALFLKVYDIRLPATLSLLSILVQCYEKVTVTKPLSSRPANSEKYLLCTGFHGCSGTILDILRSCVRMGCLHSLEARIVPTLSLAFMKDVVDMNELFIARQIKCIDRTIAFILEYEAADDGLRKTLLDRLCQVQVRKCMSWCRCYGIHISREALQQYDVITDSA